MRVRPRPRLKVKKKPELSEADRQTISQAIQAAIEEAKATVTLNPQKAVNWENLASIYRNIINVAQGADSWTVSAYQRAIILGPQNPTYRVSLGASCSPLRIMMRQSNYLNRPSQSSPTGQTVITTWPGLRFKKRTINEPPRPCKNTITLLDPKKTRLITSGPRPI